MAAPRRVTVIDDAPDLLALFGDALGSAAHVTLLSGVATISEIHDTEPELLVIDLRLGTDSLPGWNMYLLPKPFSMADLEAVLEEALGEPVRAG